MGCASSSPVVKVVDAAKETANDVVTKGGQTLSDAGQTAKDGLQSGMDHVKEGMESALNTVENSIGSVVGKIEDTFTSKTKEAKEAVGDMEKSAEETYNKASEAAAEAVSDAETVVVSEAEHMKETVSSTTAAALEKAEHLKTHVGHGVSGVTKDVKDALHLEDVENIDNMLGDSVEKVDMKTEEIINNIPTPAASPKKEPKEELPPTFWEAAHDAIVQKRMKPPLNFRDLEIDVAPTRYPHHDIEPAEAPPPMERDFTDLEHYSEARVRSMNRDEINHRRDRDN